jgi:hypothetical protein
VSSIAKWQLRMAFPTTEDRIAAEEAKLGLRLPSEYRNRLISQNGGELETAGDVWQVNPVFDSSDRKRAGRTASHIYRETQQALQWHGFPVGAVAIASNGTGDLLVILPGKGGSLDGRVHYWDHETGKIEPTPLDFT